MTLTLLKGTPRRSYKPDFSKCLDLCIRYLSEWESEQGPRDSLKRHVYWGVRTINAMPRVVLATDPASVVTVGGIVNGGIAQLNINEFIQLFPTDKDYDGEKWQVKDHFSAMESATRIDPSVPIGNKQDRVFSLLQDWHNGLIRKYTGALLCAMQREV